MLAVQRGRVPPTLNFEQHDSEAAHWSWEHVHTVSRKTPIRAAISNSFGFGGTNASLLFRRLDCA